VGGSGISSAGPDSAGPDPGRAPSEKVDPHSMPGLLRTGVLRGATDSNRWSMCRRLACQIRRASRSTLPKCGAYLARRYTRGHPTCLHLATDASAPAVTTGRAGAMHPAAARATAAESAANMMMGVPILVPVIRANDYNKDYENSNGSLHLSGRWCVYESRKKKRVIRLASSPHRGHGDASPLRANQGLH